MNFFPFHIGDYVSATRHLTWDEDMAYRRMLDAYYLREAPLPSTRREIYRLVQASEERQREAVNAILEEFFELRDDGWHNSRADEELAKFTTKREKARKSADARWSERNATASPSSNANASKTDANASKKHANAMRPQCEGNATNTNTKTSKDIVGLGSRASVSDSELERALRIAAGWEGQPAPMLAVTGEIQALIDTGADLELDVLPVIKALAPQAQPVSWRYFTKPIARARDQRIEAATIVSLPTVQTARKPNGTHQRKPSRAETFDAIYRRIDELEQAERRAAESGSSGDGSPDEGAA